MFPQVFSQPFPLAGCGPATANFLTLAVKREDVPSSEVIAVVPVLWVSGRRSEISVVTGGASAVVLMISGSRPSTVLEAAPRRLITICEIFIRTIGICQVTSNKNRTRYLLDQFCSRIRTR